MIYLLNTYEMVRIWSKLHDNNESGLTVAPGNVYNNNNNDENITVTNN